MLRRIWVLGSNGAVMERVEVAQLLNLTAEDVAEIHWGNTTKLSYRLALA